ncbi:outer membrane autotransporter protein [Azospirillum fermentarium]|uniref:autotransporter outer membrane beta-barrel domain-containing protein n=1 Tax=Azospirillum fermentarium TaxID=1233114 RepID=UPI0022268BD7|nr:autotransporter outer membrane beta-barrel domain-containing protein [Azospirillum fermentarium]MCW2248124.1 outer membrane autotransporter protein [Azospirillum fermentarium]
MASLVRSGLMAGVLLTAAANGPDALAQATATVTRPDGTTIETAVLSPTSIRVTVSGGPDFTQPMVVNYTNISYSASEIVYQGTYTYKGVTEAVTCRVNTATQAVTGSGACQNALGGSSSSSSTTTGTTTGTTTTATTTTTTGTTTGTTVTQTATLPDNTVTSVTVTPRTAAEQTRAWVQSGALSALMPGDGVALALQGLAGNPAAGLEPVFLALSALASDADRAAAARQLQPATPSATATNAVATAKAVATTVLGRALSVRGGAGVSTGDLTDGLGLWVQPFGYGARQDHRDGQDGYLDRTLGVAVGADVRVADQTRVGLALTYLASAIDGRGGSSGDRTSVKGGNASLYAQYEAPSFYVVGQVSAGISGYDSRRSIPLTGQAADADYRGWQVGVRVDGGVPLALGGGWQATPMAGLAYVHSRVNGYTETGAGALNLSVDDTRNNALTGSLGGRVSYDHTGDGLTWTPYLQAVASYDVIGKRPETTARFLPAGSAAFVTRGADPARFGGDVTLGLDLATASNVTVNLAYTYGLREDFQAHGGGVRVRIQY